MKLSIFDLKKVEEKVLSELIKETIKNFPILKEIYDEEFQKRLVKNRYFFNNYLLWLLSSKEPYTELTWKEISRALFVLKESNALSCFKDKIKSTDEYVFKSYQTELDYAAYYKEKGYNVQLEPKLVGKGKKPEFKIESDDLKIYFF